MNIIHLAPQRNIPAGLPNLFTQPVCVLQPMIRHVP